MSKSKFKEYLEYLYLKQNEFSKEYKIYIDKKFDPRKYLTSLLYPYKPLVHAILIPTKSLLTSWEEFKNGTAKYIEFDFVVYTEGKQEKYNLTLKYVYLKKRDSLYPAYYSHNCPFLQYYGNILVCKHLYAALREIDKLSEVRNDIKIAKSMFFPRNLKLLKEYEKIEREKLSPIEKLKKSFEIIEEHMYLNELKKLELLNIRLKHLSRI